MSKRNSEGEVLANIFAVKLAQSQSQLATLLGGAPQPELQIGNLNETNNDEDLRRDYVDDEAFGVGAPIPKDIEDGSFTRRIPGSTSDKLLQQLLGKKAAKAHIARQAASQTTSTKPQAQSKPQRNTVKEESEDEEEGRASAFKSKRRRIAKVQPVEVDVEEHGDSSKTEKEGEAATEKEHNIAIDAQDDDDSAVEESRKKVTKSRPQKAKAGSYLDELLAERSKKKQRKTTSKVDA